MRTLSPPHEGSKTMVGPPQRKPLRGAREPGVALDGTHLSLGGPDGYCTDADWKKWKSVSRSLSDKVRERNCTARLPRCRSPEQFEPWLEQVNWLIGRSENFPDRKAYELIDLDPGSDVYTLLFCRKGYRFPKSALYKDDENETA